MDSDAGSALQLGKLTSIDPRLVWAHEAHDFTPWLLENAEFLAETLGIEIELTENEHPVGGYSLDLLGKDLTNDCTLIVENQLTTTDHSHLGQLLTYAAGTDAATVVWIATQFREEHRQAVAYLNEIAGENARFFAIEINVVRIGTSPAAPLFKLVEEPNDWHAAVSASAKAIQTGGSKGVLYLAYWEKFLDELHQQMPNWSKARKPQTSNWMDLQWPMKGVRFSVSFAQHQRLRAELYLDTGDADETEALFGHLQAQQAAIENAFGGPLEWNALPGKRACRICIYGDGDVSNEADHSTYVAWMLDKVNRLRQAFPQSRLSAMSQTGPLSS
jgi:hypothetical protein